MLKNTIPARIDFNIDNLPQKSTIDEIISFTYPRLRENDPAWYVEFYAFDPVRGKSETIIPILRGQFQFQVYVIEEIVAKSFVQLVEVDDG